MLYSSNSVPKIANIGVTSEILLKKDEASKQSADSVC